MARAQSGDGGKGCGLSDDASALAPEGVPPAIAEAIASVAPASRRFLRSVSTLLVMASSFDCRIDSLRGDLLDVRQNPDLVEELLLRSIHAEHQLEAALRIGRHPVR